MDLMDYRKRLGLCTNDKYKTSRFFAQLHNYFKAARDVPFDEVIEECFCNKIGVQTQLDDGILKLDWDSPIGLTRAWEYLKDCKSNFLELLFRCVCLINEFPDGQSDTRNALIYIVSNSLDDCHIPYELLRDDNGIFIFPKGAKELDDALVSQPLDWLAAYPRAYKTFCNALRQYSEGIYIRDVADNLRKALEEFLQEFLGNAKNLETNKNEICKYLGEQGVDAGVSGLFHPLINAYKNINDRIAKHNDAVDEKLLEFLLYQTGVLIRMVIVTSRN